MFLSQSIDKVKEHVYEQGVQGDKRLINLALNILDTMCGEYSNCEGCYFKKEYGDGEYFDGCPLHNLPAKTPKED